MPALLRSFFACLHVGILRRRRPYCCLLYTSTHASVVPTYCNAVCEGWPEQGTILSLYQNDVKLVVFCENNKTFVDDPELSSAMAARWFGDGTCDNMNPV